MPSSLDMTESPPETGRRPASGGKSLQAMAIRGSGWAIASYGVTQVCRLASSLILSRLLTPEIFGVSALLTVFLQALEMVSDLGQGVSIVRDPPGDDPDFINTAWTIQASRGFVLWAGAAAIAWPIAQIYGSPQMIWLLPVAGFGAVLRGVSSMAPSLYVRHMRFAQPTLLDVGAQVATIVATVGLAYVRPSIWSIVVGALIGTASRAVLSHLIFDAPPCRPTWDRASVATIVRFGKWVTGGTALTFVANLGDRLIIGYFLTKSQLGIYSIALTMAQSVSALVIGLADRIILPLYSRLGVDKVDRARVRRLRSALRAFALPPVCLLIVVGPRLINFLYDARYHDAGWIVRVLACGTIAAVITSDTSAWP